MRVASAGVGVDCGGGDATEREPRTQQRHILAQETEEAVLSSPPHDAPRDGFLFRAAPPACFGSITTAEAGMMACQRSGNVKKREQDGTVKEG